jgi:Zn-dependent M28 family amino/carboxypeptidase
VDEGWAQCAVVRRTLATLAVMLFVGALVGCDPHDEGTGNAPKTTPPAETPSTNQAEEGTARLGETTASSVNDPSNAESNVAKTVAGEIDKASIRTHLAHLTGLSPAPLASGAVAIAERGSLNGRKAAAEYIQKSFEASGIPARTLTFTSAHGPGFNVEATLRGTDDEKHLWVTAHLDSVHNAGANDDASGLISVLMTARALEDLDLKHTVHFVAYDLEEVGLVGSSVYMRSVVSPILAREGDKAIIGNLNSDIVGYEEGRFDAEIVTCSRGGTLDDAVLRASKEIDSPIKLHKTCLPGRSDHRRFWDAGLPAVWMFERGNDSPYPWTHEPGDTMDKVNIAYLRSMIQLTAAATALLAVPERAS